MTVKIYHTASAMFVGEDAGELAEFHGERTYIIKRPVIFSVTEKAVSMTPFYTLTESDTYHLPHSKLCFAEPMAANTQIADKYRATFNPSGFELTTSPRPI